MWLIPLLIGITAWGHSWGEEREETTSATVVITTTLPTLSRLHQAIRDESWDRLEEWESHQGLALLLNRRGMFGRTALFLAQSPMMLEWLLDRGADPVSVNDFGDPILLQMVQQNRPRMVEILLRHGADATQSNSFGNTPLRESKWQRNIALYQLLQQSTRKNERE